ncbi:aminotransferase class IV [Sedimentibacter sp. B4]|uniref:aminotransferase class IV n=1 Tax=Sedimentibacter sp. B4 TaxID=304766 RepID=UPI00031B87D9|nr:aminotransferase class IV [Sedimentibacter sp. B4]
MINIVSHKNVANNKLVSKEEMEELLKKDSAKIYEVIRVVEGRPVFLREHFDRMNESIRLSGLKGVLDYEYYKRSAEMLISANNLLNCNIRVSYYFTHEDVLLFYFIESHYPSKKQFQEGVDTVTVKTHRKNPNVKAFEKNFKEEVQKVIDETGSFEAILVNDDNTVSEGSKSNIFFIKKNKIITSPDEAVLLGVTRSKVIEVCMMNNVEVEKRTVHFDELNSFDAAFITGTSNDVLPIRKIDEKLYNSAGNDFVRKVSRLYLEEMKK